MNLACIRILMKLTNHDKNDVVVAGGTNGKFTVTVKTPSTGRIMVYSAVGSLEDTLKHALKKEQTHLDEQSGVVVKAE